jgi:hypothetical protein
MTKTEALELVAGIRAAVIYGLVLKAAPLPNLAKDIRTKVYGFEGKGNELAAVDLSVLAQILEDPSARKTLVGNLQVLLKHALVRNTHEVICMYAEETAQFDTYRQAPFFQYARIVRNTLSHKDGSILHRWPADLTKASITHVEWRGRRINQSDVGNVLALDPWELFTLHEDLVAFLRNGLT